MQFYVIFLKIFARLYLSAEVWSSWVDLHWQFGCDRFTHPITNRARRTASANRKKNALPLSQAVMVQRWTEPIELEMISGTWNIPSTPAAPCCCLAQKKLGPRPNTNYLIFAHHRARARPPPKTPRSGIGVQVLHQQHLSSDWNSVLG